jgi:putative inorganic carbon (hco3(-)) transporter
MNASDHLYAVKVKGIWEYLKTQDTLFWLINIYLFLEYVRPQTLYPVLDIMPYAKMTLIATLLLLIFRNQIGYVKNIQNVFILLFFFVILLSSVFAISFDDAIEKIPEFISWMIVYFLIINIVNTQKRFFIFMLAFLLYSFKMAQFSFKKWAGMGFAFARDGAGGGPGWFHNSGEFGIQMCIFLSLSAYFFLVFKQFWPRWKKLLFCSFPLMALTGTISSSSRGALVGAVAVILWIMLKSHYKIKGLFVGAFAVVLIFILMPEEQMARFETAGEDDTSIARIERWEKGKIMLSQYPLLGVGFNNWSIADRTLFGGEGGLSHNIFIECMAELGYAGLTVFSLMILYTFVNNHRTRRIASLPGSENRFIYYMAHGLDAALVGYLVSGFFVTVLYYPYFWINLAMTVALHNIARNALIDKSVDRV